MIFSRSLALVTALLSLASPVNSQVCGILPESTTGFTGEPDWQAIIEIAFPPWAKPANGCPRLNEVGGELLEGYKEFPIAEEGKFNPCYYTKAFAGLDPLLGGYPSPIDTHYPYEFAAPFMRQPGDGSTHHCPLDSPTSTPIQSCPQVKHGCDNGAKDCVKFSDDHGYGHFPPFVALAAVKNAYNECAVDSDVCEWFDYDTSGCNIPKSTLDKLVYKSFGVKNTIQFQPPVIIDGLPSNTFYRQEYINQDNVCAENCRGPHYCSLDVATEDVWGDFCPYVHTGEKAGMYRHPHIALAAFELWIANLCMPEKCSSTWLDSPNGKNYGASKTSTSITWCEMENNEDLMSQPAVPYQWPNSGTEKSIFPGLELYEDMAVKPAAGSYVMEYVALKSVTSGATSGVAIGLATSGIMMVSTVLSFIW